ncbi:hypothetical protein D1AOALGA4SA_5218 [Olavius algarvensis Delta 1 endosymbiont]|nr:hypothetical protein D1AOALGA4SA_5218 [Olavius algarvensis Delta 1 endosymbiont]
MNNLLTKKYEDYTLNENPVSGESGIPPCAQCSGVGCQVSGVSKGDRWAMRKAAILWSCIQASQTEVAESSGSKNTFFTDPPLQRI